jgi:hypothetical protein
VVRTTNDEFPTPENSVEVTHEVSSQGGMRGSIVWFTQASLIQSAELPFGSISEVREAERKWQRKAPRDTPYFHTHYNVSEALENGIFRAITVD